MEWKNTRIAFLGGDLRLIHTAFAFEAEGADCVSWGIDDCGEGLPVCSSAADAIQGADLIILGIPVSRDGNTLNAPLAKERIKLSELVDLLSPKQKIAMGMAPVRFKQALEEKGCICCDYSQDDYFATANALATAEGALAIAIEKLPDTLFGADCAIMGFGRIGKQLARLLTAVGARVTIFARRESDLAYAATLGCHAEPICRLGEAQGHFDLLFNTIPVQLDNFPSPNVRGIIIDLAPVYGESEQPTLLRAPSLPYRYSPRSSGKLIHACILRHFSSEKEGSA